MSDLISRSALAKAMGVENAVKYGNETAEQQHNSYDTLMKYEIADYIEDAPAVDAVPVVHARWVHEQRYGDSGGWVWRCTACRRESITPIIFAMKYCNACGAKMDAKGDEESE